MTDSERTTLERIRVKLGLPVPAFLREIGARPGRRSLLRIPDNQVDRTFMQAAIDLEGNYDAWKTMILATIPESEPVRVRDLAKILLVSDFTLWRSIRQGKLKTTSMRSTVHGRIEQHVTRDQVKAFFATSERALADQHSEIVRCGQLTLPFLHALHRDRQTMYSTDETNEEQRDDRADDQNDADQSDHRPAQAVISVA